MAPQPEPTEMVVPKLLLSAFGIEVTPEQCTNNDDDCEWDNSGPTPTLIKRQQFTTISVLSNGPAPSSAAASPSSTPQAASFPVAVAIPALVGGMALAVIGFGIYWWMAKKKRKEKRRRWEAAQRRQRKRAESAAARRRPSVSKGYSEKSDAAPPMPILPKTAAQEYKEKANPQEAYHPPAYAQPAPAPNDPYAYNYNTPDDSQHQQGQQVDFSTPLEEKPGRPSRSAARAAASDAAAANATAGKGYKPNKPSRLGGNDSDMQETLDGQQHLQPNYGSPNPSNRQVSGEWGVGNNNNNYTSGGGNYDNDPYLQQQRAPSGQYSVDPYSAYHGGEEPPVSKRGGGWV